MNVERRDLGRVLARTDQLDPMIAPLQAVDDARERHRDTVHLGRIGFRDNGYPQGRSCGWKLLKNKQIVVHAR